MKKVFGDTTLIHGNSQNVLPAIESESVDLTVTSPPYDDMRTYESKDVFTWEIFDTIAKELFRVTKQGGVVVWVVADQTISGSETCTSFRQALRFKELGFFLHDTMIYLKNGMAFPDMSRYFNSFEYMFVLSKGKPKTFNPIADKVNVSAGEKDTGRQRTRDGRLVTRESTLKGRIRPKFSRRTNVWKFSTGFRKSSKDNVAHIHPAIFPEKLARDHIISWSNKGDTVLDPFMGSGTTAKMAKKLGRKFIGIEKNEKYFKLSCLRAQR